MCKLHTSTTAQIAMRQFSQVCHIVRATLGLTHSTLTRAHRSSGITARGLDWSKRALLRPLDDEKLQVVEPL
jgi:hypothetical protein